MLLSVTREEKLRRRFFSKPPPKDFSWANLVRLLGSYGYSQMEGAGSRIKFINDCPEHRPMISLHKRHPDSTLLEYQIIQVRRALKEQEFIDEG